MKVSFFDKKVRKTFSVAVSWIATILSFVLIFLPELIGYKLKIMCASGLIGLFVLVYFVIWWSARKSKETRLKINGIDLCVKTGDLFGENENLKLIPFNEHFDTKVDDVIISSSSLNGIYINKFFEGSEADLADRIRADKRIQSLITSIETYEDGQCRMTYPLGTIHKEGKFLLLAFTKFNHNNEAYLDSKSLWESFSNMWREIGIVHSGKSIDLPLLGSGITRLVGVNICEQELLELLLMSLRVSGLQLNWNISLNIIIHPKNAKYINFYKLSDYSD